jgi:hypothetical protein
VKGKREIMKKKKVKMIEMKDYHLENPTIGTRTRMKTRI